VSIAIAIVATVVASFVPILGSAVPGIVIGVVVGAIARPGALLRPGIVFSSKFVLQLAVVVLGCQLSLAQIAKVGLESLPVMLITLAVCLGLAWLLTRALRIDSQLGTLIGVGTGICGASAIAAVSPVIGAVGADVAYAVSTIFLFNISAVILFPIVGHLLGLSQHAFGLFAGTAVNDTSSVVAAASSYGPVATNYAVVVKLVRTLMIIPISVALAAITARAAERERVSAATGEGATAGDEPPSGVRLTPMRVLRLIPWFLIGFVVVALVNSTGIIPVAAHPALSSASVFLITVALSAIGLSTDFRAFRRAGAKPLLLGGCLWVAVSATSLLTQWAFGLI
jgi:uncharacterized membrane protein YadS